MNMILLFIILLPIFITTIFIPYWTRRTESFGVTIPEEIYHTDKLKKMRKNYVLYSTLLSVVTTIIFLLLGSIDGLDDNTFASYLSILIFFYIFAHFFIYLYFHRMMKQLKTEEDWSKDKAQQVFIDTGFRKQKLTHSNLWYGISFLITFASIAITFKYYDRFPERIPMQYNFDGLVTNWADKSPRAVLMMPIMSLYLTLLFTLLNTLIGKAKQQISAVNPKESMQQNIIFRRRWSAYLIATGIGLTLLFAFIQLTFIFPIDTIYITIVPLAFAFILTAGAIILSITTGQGGSRVKTSTGTNGEVIDRDDDKYWKLGMFYFNPYDPAFFLEKRFGVGWTINFARPFALVALILILVLAIGIPYLLGL